MRVGTSKEKAKNALAMWDRQYPDPDYVFFKGTTNREERKKLIEAGKDHNKWKNLNHESWVCEMCCECKEYVDTWVEFDNDYPSAICLPCLNKAKRLFP